MFCEIFGSIVFSDETTQVGKVLYKLKWFTISNDNYNTHKKLKFN